MKADIDPQKTPKGRVKAGQYDVTIVGYDKGGLRYFSLTADELDAITEAWARERVKQGALL
jgi:hypothetical protein